MKSILFVDDEPQILDSLKTLLKKQRKDWHMSFVQGAANALDELLAVSYDVIVSDMHMPGMDGAALLTRVRDEYPHIVRIVLAGPAEQQVARRLVHVAHQFLAKPCDGRDLQQTIQRACDLQSLLEAPALREAVGKIGQLPIRPALYAKLSQLLANSNASIGDAAAIIERDIGISSKILQVVNSAFFGLARRVADIRTAVSYLGLEMVKALVLSTEINAAYAGARPCPGFSLDRLQEHGFASGRIVRRLLNDKIKAQDAFAASILQDTGRLVMMTRLPETFRRIVDESHASQRSVHEVETELLGVSHAEIGAYLLGIWGLPFGIVEAVAHHHAPARAVTETWDVVGAVHVAACLAGEGPGAATAAHNGAGMKLDVDYLRRIGQLEHLEAWKAIATEELSRGQAD